MRTYLVTYKRPNHVRTEKSYETALNLETLKRRMKRIGFELIWVKHIKRKK